MYKTLKVFYHKISLLIQFVLRILISLYQYGISPLLGNHCRFYPSCSAYAKQALEQHTLFSALKLTLKRLASCHPWHKGGYDPVPAYKSLEHK